MLLGTVAMLPAPSCMHSRLVSGSARISGGTVQQCRARWATLSARRQQAAAPTRLQPLTVAKAKAAKPDGPEARALLSNQRGSPHKVRRVLDVIRGRSYEEALKMLTFMPYRACEPVLQTLLSAAANAKNNLGLRASKLYVSECSADGAPLLKRIRPRAKGRAARILKPTFHMTIKVAERPQTSE